MLYLTFITGLLALVSSSAAYNYRRCFDDHPSEEFRVKAADLEPKFIPLTAINIETFAHVVTTQAKKGHYPLSQVQKQIVKLNKGYKKSGISFTLASTDYTVNNAWATAEPYSSSDVNMRSKLHKGTYADLNIYFLSNLDNSQMLGVSTFPRADIDPKNSSDTTYIKQDGCLILADSMPGGDAVPYNLGATAIHEVGHWFGLFHVFAGYECSGVGDAVRDTPPQKTATNGCPKSKNTCPGGGPDSIHNYMDFSDDRCLNEFTPGQTRLMKANYNRFRACDGACS